MPPTRKPRVLLRNGWQSINIGDIAHYMGMMELFRKYGIEADVRFWTSNMENGAAELFRKHFPEVPFFNDAASDRDRLQGVRLPAARFRFRLRRPEGRQELGARKPGKPFGVMGISLPGAKPRHCSSS